MVNIYCNSDRCEYDIRALVMAFFPYTAPDYHISEENYIKNHVEACSNENTEIYIFMHERSICIECKGVKKEHIFEDIPDTKKYRDELKRLLYKVLEKVTGRALMWGTLTGVRPAKLAVKRILSGYSDEQVKDYMKKEFFCSDEKAELCTEVASKEAEILKKIGFYKGYSVYIGIPFCPTVCTYCSFSSMPVAGMSNADELVARYIEALGKECEYIKKKFYGQKLTSIYVGGGTPTVLNEKYLKRLMDIINSNFDVKSAEEFTVEAGRPDTINEEKLAILKSAGVTRISVNPQTMNDNTLLLIGRKHTAEQTVYAYNLARKAGFDNINMDIIAGLGTENTDDFSYTLERINELEPDSFTVHSLVVKRASEYRRIREADGIKKYSGQTVSQMLNMAMEYAGKNGYKPYYMYRQKNKAGLSESPVLENVGYAKEGKESIYNIVIMEERQTVVAIGAGAQSKLVKPYDPYSDEVTGVIRNSNVKNVYEYIDRIDEMIERKERWTYGQSVN